MTVTEGANTFLHDYRTPANSSLIFRVKVTLLASKVLLTVVVKSNIQRPGPLHPSHLSAKFPRPLWLLPAIIGDPAMSSNSYLAAVLEYFELAPELAFADHRTIRYRRVLPSPAIHLPVVYTIRCLSLIMSFTVISL